MIPSPIFVAADWRAAALHCLCETDPATKVADTRALHAAWLAGGGVPAFSGNGGTGEVAVAQPDPARIPGRPARPQLVPPREVGRRPMNTVEGRAALIHALAHIEFNAINLALDAAWRFDAMPEAFFDDWLRVAAEEALHFSLLDAHLRKLGYAYGDFSAHNSLWEMADSTKDDLLARMALVPRTLEARGLDATPAIQAKLAQAGDAEAAAILGIILRDEVGHVAIGNRWYGWLCERDGLDPIAIYPDMARRHRAPIPKGPFNFEARRAAGFSDEELAALRNPLAAGT